MSRTESELAPTFIVAPKIKEEDDGNRLVIECELNAIPQPEVVWYKDEQIVPDGHEFRIWYGVFPTDLPHHYVFTLDLNDVYETDAGLYRIYAKNLMGDVSASIRLNFTRKSNRKPINISKSFSK